VLLHVKFYLFLITVSATANDVKEFELILVTDTVRAWMSTQLLQYAGIT